MGLASEGVVLQQVELGFGFRTQLANPSLPADTELLPQATWSQYGALVRLGGALDAGCQGPHHANRSLRHGRAASRRWHLAKP